MTWKIIDDRQKNYSQLASGSSNLLQISPLQASVEVGVTKYSRSKFNWRD